MSTVDSDLDLGSIVEGPLPGRIGLSSWDPVNLAEILSGKSVAEVPDICSRTDGRCLFYLRRTHWLHSPPEAGKTWLADLAITEVIESGFTAVLFDFEDTAASTVDRLRRIGADDSRILANLRYVRPDEPLNEATLQGLKSDVLPGALLVVIDATTPAMALDGLDPISTKDTATWLQRLPAAATAAGAAVLVLDHVVKADRVRGRWAIGSGQKLAVVTGAAYSLTAHQPIAPGHVGRSTINIAKDRPGAVRAASAGNIAGELVVDARDPDHLNVRIEPPSGQDGEFRPTVLMGRVSDYLEQCGEQSTNAVEKAVTGKRDAIRLALRVLETEGFITSRNGPRSSTLYLSIKPFEGAE